MARQQSFSKRHGYSRAKDIAIREDAPESLRSFVLQAVSSLGWGPGPVLRVVCQVLHVPRSGGTKRLFRAEAEAQGLIDECPWFKVYDIIEALHAHLAQSDDQSYGSNDAALFTDEINEFFIDEGIGWQLVDGHILTRGTEAFEAVVTAAIPALEASERPTAAKHLHEALQDLSRRPQADLPGAAYHAMGTLECVARDLIGDPKATLGVILKGPSRLASKAARHGSVAGLGICLQ